MYKSSSFKHFIMVVVTKKMDHLETLLMAFLHHTPLTLMDCQSSSNEFWFQTYMGWWFCVCLIFPWLKLQTVLRAFLSLMLRSLDRDAALLPPWALLLILQYLECKFSDQKVRSISDQKYFKEVLRAKILFTAVKK